MSPSTKSVPTICVLPDTFNADALTNVLKVALLPVKLLIDTPEIRLPSMLPVKSILLLPPEPSLFKMYNDSLPDA